MISTDPRIRVCGVCARVLDCYPDGWEHTAGTVWDGDGDHLAVPVAPGEVFAVTFCDFCYAPDPDWVIPATDCDFSRIGSGSVGDWSSCRACADLVEAGRWNDLKRRTAAGHHRRHGEHLDDEARSALSYMHRILRQHITGSARPFVYPSPDNTTGVM